MRSPAVTPPGFRNSLTSNGIQDSIAMTCNRRKFLVGTATTALCAGAAPLRAATIDDIPIIDCHIHLFDGSRPQGAPYKGGRAFPGGVALPAMYAKLARPLGIVGALEVDASPWVEDNLWVLETIQPESIMVGTVGNLQPEKPEFGEYLDRYARNPLYRGIRYGNVWKYNLPEQVGNPQFIEGLKQLADHDLVLETANQNIALLEAAVRVNDAVPNLRIVLDHLPALDPTPETQSQYEAVLKEIAQRKNIWTKLSEIVHPVRQPGAAPVIVPGLAAHRERLDLLMGYFGEDRVVFGSDWPNAVGVSEVPDTVALVRAYFAGKSREAAEKYFWKNSVAAYKWVRRAPNQPKLS
jgi:predicted TIM-barrel fold metal-dependent hydrolase